MRRSHLNHHLKSEDSREDIIQILENLGHRITAAMNPVTDADVTPPPSPRPVRALKLDNLAPLLTQTTSTPTQEQTTRTAYVTPNS